MKQKRELRSSTTIKTSMPLTQTPTPADTEITTTIDLEAKANISYIDENETTLKGRVRGRPRKEPVIAP